MNKAFAILPFVVAFLSVQCLLAQNAPDPSTLTRKRFFSKIELAGGPSLSFLRGNPSVDNNAINSRAFKLGYSFGFGATHPLSEKIELTGMLLIERKGTIMNFTSTYFDDATQTLKIGEIKDDYKYDYRSLALILDYSFGRKTTFRAGVGPYISYLENQVVKRTYTPQGAWNLEDQILFDKRWDFGCAIKFSCIVPLNKKISFQTQLLNLWGLANTRADPNYGVIKTNNTNLLFGIIIKR